MHIYEWYMEAANKREKMIADKILSQPNILIIKDKEARTLWALTYRYQHNPKEALFAETVDIPLSLMKGFGVVQSESINAFQNFEKIS